MLHLRKTNILLSFYILKYTKPIHICIVSSHSHNSPVILGSCYCCHITVESTDLDNIRLRNVITLLPRAQAGNLESRPLHLEAI